MDASTSGALSFVGGSGQEHVNSPEAWKTLFSQAVEDLGKVTEKNILGRVDRNLEVKLDFVCRTIAVWPDMFVVMATEEEEEDCFDFTCWTMSRLLQLLAQTGSDGDVCRKALTVVTSLLEMLKGKDAHTVWKQLSRLVSSLIALARFNERYYDDTEPQFNEEVKLDCFVTSSRTGGSGDLPPVSGQPIVLSGPEACEQLSIAITGILASVAVDLCQYTAGGLSFDNVTNPSALWDVLIYQLNYGEVQLKTVTLGLSNKLMQHGRVPAFALDGFLDCVVLLVELLCSGTSDIEGDYINLETTLAAWLDTANERRRDDNVSLRNDIVQRLAQTIRVHQTTALKTSALKGALLRILSEHIESIPSEMRLCLIRVFLHDIESVDKIEVEHFLVQSLLSDTGSYSSVSLPAGAGDTDDTASSRPPSLGLLMVMLQQLCKQATEITQSDVLSSHTVFGSLSVLVEVMTSTLHCQCRQTQSKYSHTLSPIILVAVSSSCTQFMRMVATSGALSSDQLTRCYGNILRISAALLSIHDVVSLTTETLEQFAWLASLPWIPNDLDLDDLQVTDRQEMKVISVTLMKQVGVSAVIESVIAMALLPNQFAPRWRSRILQMALTHREDQVRQAVVEAFPLFLHRINLSPDTISHLLRRAVQDESEAVQLRLAQVVGPLVCVSCGAAVVCSGDVRKQRLLERFTVECISCDTNCEAASNCRSVEVPQFLPCLQLLQAEDKQVRVSLVVSLQRLFRHAPMTTLPGDVVPQLLTPCLQLLGDTEYDVRLAFSRTIPHVIGACCCSDSDTHQVDEVIVTKLKTAVKAACVSSNVSLMETILLTVGELGRVASSDLLLVMVIILLDMLASPFCPLAAAVARQQLKEIARKKKTKLQHLFLQFGRSICKVLVEHLHEAQHEKRVQDIITEVAGAFEFTDAKDFLMRTEHLLLPHLVKKATTATSALLRTISKQLGDPNHKGPLARNIRHIFCHLVCSCQPDELIRKCTYLEAESEWDLGSLLRFGQNVDSELLLHLGTHYDQVLTGIKILASKSGNYQWPSENITTEHLADMLQSKLLGILVHFDNHLNNGTITVKEKKQTYESLVSLIQLMGPKHITTVRVRVMTTLKIGLVFKESGFPELCANAWNCFVRSVDVQSLGLMLSQILVSLLPLLRQRPKQVAEIFSYLIVDNRSVMCSHFHELYFLPDIPELRAVNTVLKRYTASSHSSPNLKTTIEHLLKGISHESVDVRLLALTKLKTLLHKNQGSLHQLVLTGENADPVVSLTVTASNHNKLDSSILCNDTKVEQAVTQKLLRGCRTADQNTRCLYGECLGQLGAIDPGRLDFLTNQSKEEVGQFVATVIDNNFATELITELAKAFLRAEDRITQDCVAFAIQELIQIYGITNDDPVASDSEGSRLWQRFSEEVHEIMAPLMHSRYRLTLKYIWSQLVTPIYRSKKGAKFDSWVSTLAGYLSSKTKEEKPKRVFDACRGVIKNDSQMALYLLPHIVIHNLLGGSDADHEEICREILAVLQHAKEDDTRHGGASDLRHICGQTVFSLLDHLTKWTRHRIKTLSVKAASSRGVRSVSSSDISIIRISECVAKLSGVGLTHLKTSCFETGSMTVRCLHFKSYTIQSKTSLQDLTFNQDESYRRVNSFLRRIPQDILARASYNCSAYTRSLMHHELFIRSRSTGPVQDDLDFLQKLYMALDEPDGVTGITAIKQTQPTLMEQIIAFESIGQLSDASVCYDHAIRSQPDDLSLRHGLLRCRLALGELNSVMELTNGIISQNPTCCRQLNSYRVEAAWRLGQWDRLEGYLKHEDKSQSWNVGLSRILLAAKCRDEAAYVRQLRLVRNDLMGPLSAASMEMGSYHRGYEYIVRLHMLNELEQCFLTLMEFPSVSSRGQLGAIGLSSPVGDATVSTEGPVIEFASLMQQWHSRLKFSQSSFRTQEPILTLRRTVLGLCSAGQRLDKVIGQCWLETARIARKCSLVQTAQSSLLSASAYKLPEFCIENAKWLWDRGDYDKAQMCLEKGVEEYYPDRTLLRSDSSQESGAEHYACAKVLLLLGNYCEETASWESNAIMRQYKEVIKVHSDWEDGYFHIAKYYDKIMTNLIESDRPEKKGEFVIQVVQYFGQSLLHGNQYIYQSMPRMLTLWLDYGVEVTEAESRSKNEVMLQGMRTVLQHLNKLMSGFSQKLAAYQFLTAFPQLISRICHTHTDVFTQLKEITARLLATFPQQAMWLMMAVSKSSFQTRVKRCQEIFGLAKTMNRDLTKFILDATKLTERLLDLCNKHIDGSTIVLSLSQHFKPLKRLVEDHNFSRVMLPLQSLMSVSLPSVDITPASHSPFPGTPVYITGIEDTIEVLPSLARPKKITMLGSDGQLYTMLAKPKDDLRKDARLMEFNSIVNRCLHQNPEARRRDLHIRTFTVTPLNEECGLLEWVSHTRGIRPILLQLYKERGIYTTAKELKSLQLPPGAPLQKKLDIYKQKLLPKHPALFSDWFLNTFPDPTAWYNARLAYCRTTAVMSMVGYILGLGDRHGENILLDSTIGDCVHVDFNCLFNKGETFDYPEVVPFRLTHNMVEAMGPMGFEGVFRRSCEVTMRVMRDQSDPLMSVLKTFIYDPLVEWSKPARGRAALESGEIRNEKAQTHVNNIESRLKGILKNKMKPRGLPLSVEGQVNHLIKEATSESNLASMYIGWAAYM